MVFGELEYEQNRFDNTQRHPGPDGKENASFVFSAEVNTGGMGDKVY